MPMVRSSTKPFMLDSNIRGYFYIREMITDGTEILVKDMKKEII